MTISDVSGPRDLLSSAVLQPSGACLSSMHPCFAPVSGRYAQRAVCSENKTDIPVFVFAFSLD